MDLEVEVLVNMERTAEFLNTRVVLPVQTRFKNLVFLVFNKIYLKNLKS